MLKLTATGTLNELLQIWKWEELCKMIHIDYYNQYLIGKDKLFTITEQDILDHLIPIHDGSELNMHRKNRLTDLDDIDVTFDIDTSLLP